MHRRKFIALLGGAATWPVVGHAQQPVMPVIGCLNSIAAAPIAHLLAAFRRGLGEAGYIEAAIPSRRQSSEMFSSPRSPSSTCLLYTSDAADE